MQHAIPAETTNGSSAANGIGEPVINSDQYAAGNEKKITSNDCENRIDEVESKVASCSCVGKVDDVDCKEQNDGGGDCVMQINDVEVKEGCSRTDTETEQVKSELRIEDRREIQQRPREGGGGDVSEPEDHVVDNFESEKCPQSSGNSGKKQLEATDSNCSKIKGELQDKRVQGDENESEINGQSAASSYSDKNISSASFNMENKHSGKLVSVSPWLDRKNRQQYNHNMPSVKELAKQFDTPNRKKEEEIIPQRLPRQIHSLTARSMSREFREGLKQNVGRNFNRNILPLSESSDKSIDEEHDHCSEDSGNGSPTDSTSSAVSKLNEHVKFWKSIENSSTNLSPPSNSLELQEHN